ncbi:two pore channel protein 2-like [Babylonia areolata]|uniref:two pore channel protein 2-like n=1 Tax=Babylonia areolata TaxID=304850 RepID=UPI003FD3E8E5
MSLRLPLDNSNLTPPESESQNAYPNEEAPVHSREQCGTTYPDITACDTSVIMSPEIMDIDTSSLSLPRGVIGMDAEGELYSVNQTSAVHLRLTNDPERSMPWLASGDSDNLGSLAAGSSMEESSQFSGIDNSALIQAVVFIEDAYKYRSINHKVDDFSLRLYRHYHSTPVYIFRSLVIFILHILAFFEFPSSLTWTSDMRYRGDRIESPCWVMESLEFVCLVLLLTDNVLRAYLMGKYYFVRHKWDLGAVVILVVSLVDWAVSAGMGCTEVVRFRRMLRPFFILQNSSLMKKIVNCLCKTLPEVISVLVMLGLHLYIFTLFAMLIFPSPQDKNGSHGNHSDFTQGLSNVTTTAPPSGPSNEGSQYFSSLLDSFMSLLVLLSTANNPDVTMPAYSRNRFFSVFFIIFLIIGLYCFWNMLTAVIYNQFRGYFLSSMQSSLNRRRLGVRAAFEVLRRKTNLCPHGSTLSSVGNGVGGFVIQSVVERTSMAMPIKAALLEKVQLRPEKIYCSKDFQHLFMDLDMDIQPAQSIPVRWFQNRMLRRVQRLIVHKYFNYFGIFVAFCNVVVISAELATKYVESFDDRGSDLRIVNFLFAIYYVLEQLMKIAANGVRRYVHYKTNIFDAFVTLSLVVGEIYSAIRFGVPFFNTKEDSASMTTLWNVLRIINILIMVRLLKIIPHIKSMRVISSVLIDLVRNMKSFAGVLIVIYYVFAILGMELFRGVITFRNATQSNNTYDCGTYQQLQYWANNFDDFAASLVVLWDVMVVNNWMVFLEAYRAATSAWSYLYFVAWWLISVIIVLNLFTALIMENFIMKWDRSHQMHASPEDDSLRQPVILNTVHDMFKGMLQEPADNELLMQLCLHQHLHLER